MLTFDLDCPIRCSDGPVGVGTESSLSMANSSVVKSLQRAVPLPGPQAHPNEDGIGRSYEARRRRRARLARWVFIFAVGAPTALAAAYYGLLAAPRYVSETQFMVRSVDGSQSTSGSLLSGLLQAFGVSRSDDDSNAIIQYLQSRDAVGDLEAAIPLREMFGRKEADAFARFPRPLFGDSFERLYRYYNDRETVYIDPDTGIITIQAEAFRPEDAQAIARQLLSQAEAVVNKMNGRLEADTVRTEEAAVAEAQKVVLSAQEDVDRFRSAATVVDPTQNAAAQLTTITQLSGQVDQVLAQIQASNRLSPSNPATAALKAQADALATQIANEQKALAGSHEAVSDKVSDYERLSLLRSLADASLAAARASLDSARTDARRQHVFIEEIVSPNLPDYSTEPQRLRSVATVFAITIAAFAVLWLASIGVKERSH